MALGGKKLGRTEVKAREQTLDAAPESLLLEVPFLAGQRLIHPRLLSWSQTHVLTLAYPFSHLRWEQPGDTYLAFNAAVLAWPEGSGRTWLKVLM